MDPTTPYLQPSYPLATFPAQYPSQFGAAHSPYHYSISPYTMANEYIPHQYTSQLYYTTPQQMHPQLMANSYPPIPYDPPWYTTFWENFCCCFGCGPQSPFEAYHRDQIERMRYFEKQEKHRRSVQIKATEESLLRAKQQQQTSNTTTNGEQSNSKQ